MLHFRIEPSTVACVVCLMFLARISTIDLHCFFLENFEISTDLKPNSSGLIPERRHHNGREFLFRWLMVDGNGLTWECIESTDYLVGPFLLPFWLKYPILTDSENQMHTHANWMGKLKLFTHALSCALSIDCVHRYWIVFDLRKRGMIPIWMSKRFASSALKVHIGITPFTPLHSIPFQIQNTNT